MPPEIKLNSCPGAPAAPTEMHRHVHRVSSHERETVDERIAKLHAELKITPDEETSWGAVAQVMRDNNTAIEKMLADETAAAPKEPTAVDDLKSYQKFAQAHADGLTKLIAAFDSFYAAAPAEQQKLADRVFESFGHKGAAMHRKV